MPRANPALESVGWIVASRISVPASVTTRPARTIVRTGNRLDNREPIAEVTNMVIETGSILMPVSRALRPRTSWR